MGWWEGIAHSPVHEVAQGVVIGHQEDPFRLATVDIYQSRSILIVRCQAEISVGHPRRCREGCVASQIQNDQTMGQDLYCLVTATEEVQIRIGRYVV